MVNIAKAFRLSRRQQVDLWSRKLIDEYSHIVSEMVISLPEVIYLLTSRLAACNGGRRGTGNEIIGNGSRRRLSYANCRD
jgi:hypothetical protein